MFSGLLFGSLILHQKGMRFLIFWAFFESCLWQHMEKYAAVDKTAETQGVFPIEILKIYVIIKLGQIILTVINESRIHTEAKNMDSRKRMGKDKDGVIFPVAPNLSEMSDSYLNFIEEIKKEIENQRLKVVLNANSSMICLYWNIGRAILQKQEEEGWGAKVIDRMGKDLKDAFPDMSGFSPRNIKYMR